MYQIRLTNIDNKTVQNREVGSWRDHAREVFASCKRKSDTFHSPPLTLELIDPDGNVELSHNINPA